MSFPTGLPTALVWFLELVAHNLKLILHMETLLKKKDLGSLVQADNLTNTVIEKDTKLVIEGFRRGEPTPQEEDGRIISFNVNVTTAAGESKRGTLSAATVGRMMTEDKKAFIETVFGDKDKSVDFTDGRAVAKIVASKPRFDAQNRLMYPLSFYNRGQETIDLIIENKRGLSRDELVKGGYKADYKVIDPKTMRIEGHEPLQDYVVSVD